MPEITPAPHERRQHRRVGVILMGTLKSTGGFFECVVLDLSRGGAKLALGTPVVLAPEAVVTLMIDGFGSFRAAAVWQRANYTGIRFLDPPETIAQAFATLLAF